MLRSAAVACVLWASFFVLPAAAQATVYPQPTTPFTEPTLGSGQGCNRNAEAETAFKSEAATATTKLLYILIQDYPEVCHDLDLVYEKLGPRLFWVTEETLRNRESVEALGSKLDTLHKDLGLEGVLDGQLAVKGGLPVSDAAAEQYGHEIATATGRPLEVESTGPVSVTDPETHAKLAASTEASDEKSELLLQAIFVVVGVMLGLFILGLLKAVLDRAN